MRIGINCRSFLNKRYTGIGRYAYHLLKSLSRIDQENEYHLYIRKGLVSLNKKMPKFQAKNFFRKVDTFHRGMDKCLGKIDIYHSPSQDRIKVNNGAKIIVTVHDLIFKAFPEGHTQKTVDETEQQFQHIIERSERIICCSENTKKDLWKYFQVPDKKISLIYQGVDKSVFYPLSQEEKLIADKIIRKKGVREPYILSVGTIEPRKNLENVLYAFDKLKTRRKFKGKLVVIGMTGWMSEGIEGLIRKLELSQDVIFLGYITDTELRYFYNNARAFVFPSLYEGFGFPIVEAFCCGVPVVTSNVSSCPEVASDAALLVNPYDPEEIAEAVAKIVNEAELGDELIRKGFERKEIFDFDLTAQKTLEVYKEVYNS